ncbi:MAG: hypothetical protein B7Y86_09995 [Brevundimonas subvibrioides]|uniref:Uncharacterized protein n=1 Tax=Brevundimonas subvibrioides TaxID=74313 RepID=A0A258HL55_9CAUL|nr:hypothetical protein [Brevundimonas subvibrioides]OYX57053.1 MAG: hypothetical protein B7Y86_09995 [Brevundimonas subvibrioides]
MVDALLGLKSVFKGQSVPILGALGATLLGAGVALEFDRLVAVADHLMLPVGQQVLIGAVTTAGLTGFLVWVTSALIARSIIKVALEPYDTLTEQLEGLADGRTGPGLALQGAAQGVRRLARVIVTFQTRLVESQRSEAALRVRYDALCHANDHERQSLMAVLLDRSTPVAMKAAPLIDIELPAGYEIPEYSAEALEVQSPDPMGEVIDLTDQLGPMTRPAAPRDATSH